MNSLPKGFNMIGLGTLREECGVMRLGGVARIRYGVADLLEKMELVV